MKTAERYKVLLSDQVNSKSHVETLKGGIGCPSGGWIGGLDRSPGLSEWRIGKNRSVCDTLCVVAAVKEKFEWSIFIRRDASQEDADLMHLIRE